jgi:hypothetical protein
MKKRSLLHALTACLILIPSLANGQEMTVTKSLHDYDNKPSRPFIRWQDTLDLTWDDFTTQDGASTSRNNIALYMRAEPSVEKIKNNRYCWDDYSIWFNPNASYYDPKNATDWNLRYFNVMFDIAELSARLTLNPSDNSAWSDKRKSFDRLINASLEAFELESGFGKDTAVIMAYEKEVREGLEQNPKEKPDLEKMETDNSYNFMEYLAYSNSTMLGNRSDYFGSFNGLAVGIGGCIKKLEFYADMNFLWGKSLKSGIYHDDQFNYDWTAGKTSKAMIAFNIGYPLYLNRYITIHPVTGIGYSAYSQKFKDQNGKKKDSMFGSSLNLNIGLDTDWAFHRIVSSDGENSSILRLRTYCAYEKNKVIGNYWSLNIGLAYVIAAKTNAFQKH